VNAGEAEELQGVLSIIHPESAVSVTLLPGGADIVVITDGTDHVFKIGNDDLTVVRALPGGVSLR